MPNMAKQAFLRIFARAKYAKYVFLQIFGALKYAPKYAKYAFLGAPIMVKWGVPEKLSVQHQILISK